MHTVNVPEEKVAQLAREELILRHYQDEFRLNELIALTEQSLEVAATWKGLPADERRRFLEQRESVLKHGDGLSATPPETSSPLLREELAEAQTAWRSAREQIKALT